MRTNAALMRAIQEHPHDDTPRLIYADWLEEQSEPGFAEQAEFIRLQVQRAHLPDDHPEQKRLRQRERQLLQQHRLCWAGCLAQWRRWYERAGGDPLTPFNIEWEFRRGFIECVTAEAPLILHLAEPMFEEHPILELRIRQIRGDLEQTRALARLTQLKRIEVLRFLPALFGENGLSDAGLRILLESGATQQLRVLDLERQRLSNAAIHELIQCQHLPNLTTLRLGHNRLNIDWHPGIDAEGIAWLTESKLFARLTHLDLESLELGLEGAEALAHGRSDHGLHWLNLHRCGLGSAGVRMLAASPNLAPIQQLDLRGNRIGIRGAQAIAAATVSQLRRLDLSSNRVTDAGVKVLCEAGHLTGLRSLSLRRNRLSDEAARMIAQNSGLCGLTCLDLRGNSIQLDGIVALAEWNRWKQLKLLDLRDNPITSAEKAQLRQQYGRRFGKF